MSSSTESQNQPAASFGSLLGSWLPWLGSSSKASASDTSPAQQPPAAQSGASDDQPGLSEQQQGDAVDLTGQWEKDTAASDMDAYARQVEMLHMSSVQTYAALHFMWGVDLNTDDQGMTLKFLVKKVPAFVFREVEHYKYGEQTSMGRRDRRSGQQTGTLTKADDGVQVDITWGEPYAAKTQEVYKLQSPAVMHLLSTVTVGGQTISSKQVYNKR